MARRNQESPQERVFDRLKKDSVYKVRINVDSAKVGSQSADRTWNRKKGFVGGYSVNKKREKDNISD